MLYDFISVVLLNKTHPIVNQIQCPPAMPIARMVAAWVRMRIAMYPHQHPLVGIPIHPNLGLLVVTSEIEGLLYQN